jgi:predicted transcriptional regulator
MNIAVEKLRLLDLVMHLNDEAKVVKLIDIIVGMENKDVVAYSALGEPLNIDQYKTKADKGLKDIEEGRFMTDDELFNDMKSW